MSRFYKLSRESNRIFEQKNRFLPSVLPRRVVYAMQIEYVTTQLRILKTAFIIRVIMVKIISAFLDEERYNRPAERV